jgi:phosphoribosylaminoimidazole-succinocarboxamide synthase
VHSVSETHFAFPGQTGFYKGKVRDVYFFGDQMAMVATDRISAFDVILPRAIPQKGAILNQLAAYFLHHTQHIVPGWLQSTPDPNVAFGLVCKPFPVEMVVRGYLVGHAWRTYHSGGRVLCGVALPEGLKEFDRLPEPIITPTTKAQEGHDEDISREEILERGLVPEAAYLQMEKYALALFAKGTEMAAARGLILADTKYEFGEREGKVYLMDEIHTPDSSRYFHASDFEELVRSGAQPRQLSKEFVRVWLMENGFMGKEGQQVPHMSDELVQSITDRYLQLFELLTGFAPELNLDPDIAVRIEKNIFGILNRQAGKR